MNKLYDVVEILKAAGWKDNCDAQWVGIEAALPELAALLSCNSSAVAVAVPEEAADSIRSPFNACCNKEHCRAMLAAAQPAAVKESLTAGQPDTGDAAAQLDALRDALRPFVGFSGHFEVSHQQAGGSASLHAKYAMTGRQFATACHALKQLIGGQS